MKGIIHTYKDSRDKEIEYADTTKMKLEEYLEHVSNKKHKVTVVCPDKHFEYILITCYIQNKKVTVVSVVKGKKDRNGKLLNDYEKGGSDLLSK
jgi:glycerol-3-phosphate dehydrogenase